MISPTLTLTLTLTLGPATGAAIYGAAAAGLFDSVGDAVEAMSTPVPSDAVVRPDASTESVYQNAFERYMELAARTEAER